MPDRLLAALGAAVALAWVVLRPDSPQGLGAVADLLVLPAVLFAEVRVLAGRSTLSPGNLAAFFGLGAVFAGTTSVVLERAAGFVFARPTLHVVGPLVEALATCAPLLLLGVSGDRRRVPVVADAALAGLASGLGLLVAQAALATGSLHVAPDYVSPLLAGMHNVPGSAGASATSFAGHAIGAALVGMAAGIAMRLPTRPWRYVPAVVALSLVVFDHALFDWRLRHLVTGTGAVSSGLVDVAEKVTLHGRLAVVLLAVGLVASRGVGRHSVGDGEAMVDLRDADAGATAAGDADAVEEPSVPVTEEGEAPAADGPGPEPVPDTGIGRRMSLVLLGSAVTIGAALAVLARGRHLGMLDQRWVALAVSVVGLGYSLWHLPSGRSPEPTTDLRYLLGTAAVASSVLGVLSAFLPDPDAVAPLHGSLLLETVLGWGAHVGNLGVVFGLGGLAAPAGGHGKRRFGDRWSGLVLRRLGWTGWSAAGRAKSPSGGRYERSSKRRRNGHRGAALEVGSGREFLWFKVSARLEVLRGRKRKSARAAGERTRAEAGRAVTLAFEPIYRAPASFTEFVGATAQEAIEAAMRQVGINLAHNSLQLVDHGAPAKPGKPGSGRPARVRVAEAGEEAADALVPPGRDSITRDTHFAVVVDVACGDEGPPQSVRVTLRANHEHRSGSRMLTCAQLTASDDRARFRSNPYAVTSGEDTTLASLAENTVAAGGMKIDNGGEILAVFRSERAAITVYDGWQQQVIGVNRRLFDMAGEHHRRLVDDLEQQRRESSGAGSEGPGIRRCIDRLRARLRAVDDGQRLLAEPLTASPRTHDDAKAFLSTALLHAAMSVEDEDMTDVAATALAAYRTMVEADPAADVATSAYRGFLVRTAPGRLWENGAYSVGDVARLLGWEGFADDDGPA